MSSKSARTVLKELLGRKKLILRRQIQILEQRREVILRSIEKSSWDILGQIWCLSSYSGQGQALSLSEPIVVSEGNEFNLNSRGIFPSIRFDSKISKKCFTLGTDDKSWLLIEITYCHEFENSSLGGRGRERATAVKVTRSDLQTILGEAGFSFYDVWSYFHNITNRWVSEHRRQYDQALKIQAEMRVEDAILSVMLRNQ